MSSANEPVETIIDGEHEPTNAREARVNVDGEGEPIGAMVFLAADELAMLGTDPEPNSPISYWIEDGDLHLE